MIISGYGRWKRKGLSRCRKLESVGAETTFSGNPFLIRGPETLKVRLPTVDSRNIGTTRRLELAERSARRPCRSATRSSGPRYRGAVSWRTLYVSTAILYWMRSGIRSQTDQLASYVTVVEDRLIMSAKYCVPIPVLHSWPQLAHPAARSLCDSWATCL